MNGEMIVSTVAGQNVRLGGPLGRGGEAKICPVTTRRDVVAKIYHSPSPERAAKVQVMIASPPTDPTAPQGHVSICWPTTLLFDSFNNSRRFVGFLMHRVDLSSSFPVALLYNPTDRQRTIPAFTWRYLIRTAKNIASAVDAIHSRGYIVGDVNESNVLVDNKAMVTVVDCDSMQVPEPGTGKCFRCPVGKAEYTPPELQGCDFRHVDRVATHDDFALGVLFFQLLMEGTHPFSGVWRAGGDPPLVGERIRIGASPYIDGSSAKPMPGAPPFGILSLELQTLFRRCFCNGHKSPSSRPTPKEWWSALNATEQGLHTCARTSLHIYGAHLAECPWCERVRLLGGSDPLPDTPPQQPLGSAHHASYAAGSKFVTPAPVVMPVARVAPPDPPTFCIFCGQANPKGGNYCLECGKSISAVPGGAVVLGAPVAPIPQSLSPASAHAKSWTFRRVVKWTFIVIGTGVLGFVALVVLVLLFAPKHQDSTQTASTQIQSQKAEASAEKPASVTTPAVEPQMVPPEARTAFISRGWLFDLDPTRPNVLGDPAAKKCDNVANAYTPQQTDVLCVYQYPGLEVQLYSVRPDSSSMTNRVTVLELTASTWSVQYGLNVGATSDWVRKTLGTPSKVEGSLWRYEDPLNDAFAVTFTIDSDRVAKIRWDAPID